MGKVTETYKRTQAYANQVFRDESINGLDTGWSLFHDLSKPEELGEITIAFSIGHTRLEVRRIILETDNPDTVAQNLVGEILIKIEKILNPKKSQNEGT